MVTSPLITLLNTIQPRSQGSLSCFEKEPWLRQHRGKTSTHAPGWAFPVTFSVTLPSHFLPRAVGSILCVACGSVVLLHTARIFDYFVVIETAFMDNQAQISETISRLDSEKLSW